MARPWYLNRPTTWHLDIDRFINPFIPASVLPKFPTPIAYFLGYRDPNPKRPAKKPPGNIAIIFFAFVGIFVTLTIIGAVGEHYEGFRGRGVPVVVGSFGAAAVLDFYAIESPLSQPRNAILGQLLSCIVGISIAKLFALSPDFESIRWLGASLACASATAVMALTGTVHPPAGATALMAVLDDKVQGLGWFLIAPVMLGCAIMLCCALLVNNIRRRFPFYWWSPERTGRFWDGKRGEGQGEEGEKGVGKSGSEETVNKKGTSGERLRRGEGEGDADGDGDVDIEAQSGGTLTESGDDDDDDDDDGEDSEGRIRKKKEGGDGGRGGLKVVITRGGVEIPEGVNLRPEEIRFLETLAERL